MVTKKYFSITTFVKKLYICINIINFNIFLYLNKKPFDYPEIYQTFIKLLSTCAIIICVLNIFNYY